MRAVYVTLLFLFFVARSYCDYIHQDFDLLMGKECGGWEKIQNKEDFEALNQFRVLYEKYKDRQFLPLSEEKIPHIIHFIWLGPKNFPLASVENIRTWVAKNPGWQVRFWTDRDRPAPCSGVQVYKIDDAFSVLRNCFDASENWGEKSDLLRYEILYREGGVYVDHDANCLKSFDPLHAAYDFYACLEMPHPSAKGLMITAGIGIVGARPSHPVIGRIISTIQEHWDEVGSRFTEKTPYMKAQLVLHRTYIVLTDVIKKHLARENNIDIIFPASYFYAGKGLEPIYSEHFYGEAWNSDAFSPFENRVLRTCSALIHRLNKIILLEGTGIAAILLLLIFFMGRSFFKKVIPFILLGFCCQAEATEAFAKLLGKETPQWKYVETEEDFRNLQIFQENYEKPLTGKSDIPKVFHFISLQDQESRLLQKTMDSWAKKHPDWKIKLWSGDSISEEEAKKGIEYVRLQILFNEGGVSFDPEFICKDRIDPLLENRDFLCFLAPLEAPFLSSSIFATPSFLAASPQNPIIQTALEKMDQGWSHVEVQFPGEDRESLFYKRGYQLITPFDASIKEALLKGEKATVLPWTVFARIASSIKPSTDRDIETQFQENLQIRLKKIERKEHQILWLSGILLGLGFGAFLLKRYDKR